MGMTTEEQILSESIKILGDIVKTQQLKIQELELRLEINEEIARGLKDVLTHLVDPLQNCSEVKS